MGSKPMSRGGKEFSPAVIDFAFRRAEGKCEDCGSHEKIEVHHIAPIWFVAKYFPQLAVWVLKSAENARCLCSKCHHKKHIENDLLAFTAQALILLSIQGDNLL